MQSLYKTLLSFFVIAALFASCTKNDASRPAEMPLPLGIPTPIGILLDQPAVKKTIGAEGGTISNGALKITVPAGAVNAPQEFSIQPITNTNPLPTGDAFRLEPHNYSFTKPVTLEFSFSDEQVSSSLPEGVGIAFQDSARVWQAQGSAILDKSAKKIRVSTTHFSDWSLFEKFHLTASAPVVTAGGTVTLELSTVEDLLEPLSSGKQVPMGKRITMATPFVKEWKLAGAGNLQSSGANATYKAPSTVPDAPNPVIVNVGLDLKDGKQYILVANITIVDDEGEIEVTVAGNATVVKIASVAVKQDGYFHIADSDGDVQGSYVLIIVPDVLGEHHYRSPDSNEGTYFHYLINGANNYICKYMNEAEELVASGGGVTITDLGKDDGFLKGTFVVNPAGYGDFLQNKIGITGKFRVKIATMQ